MLKRELLIPIYPGALKLNAFLNSEPEIDLLPEFVLNVIFNVLPSFE